MVTAKEAEEEAAIAAVIQKAIDDDKAKQAAEHGVTSNSVTDVKAAEGAAAGKKVKEEVAAGVTQKALHDDKGKQAVETAAASNTASQQFWAKELNLLSEIGFTDVAHNVVLLHEYDGEIQKVINVLLNNANINEDDWERVSEANESSPEDFE